MSKSFGRSKKLLHSIFALIFHSFPREREFAKYNLARAEPQRAIERRLQRRLSRRSPKKTR
jgi:hypothetical protein